MKRLVVSKRSTRGEKKQTLPRPAALDLVPPQELNTATISDEERWQTDMATLRKAAGQLALRRAESTFPIRKKDETRFERNFDQVLSEQSASIDKASIRALYDQDPDRAASLFNLALRDGSPEERRRIGAALAASGLVDEAINSLIVGNRENCYGEFSLLFLVAKAGEVQPLIRLIEMHPNMELRLAIVRLLASSGGPEVLSAFRRLAVNSALATEVRLALLEAINQIANPSQVIEHSAS